MKYPEEFVSEFIKSADYLYKCAVNLSEAQKSENPADPKVTIRAFEIIGNAQSVHTMAQMCEDSRVTKIAVAMLSIAAEANLYAAECCRQYDAFEESMMHTEAAKQSMDTIMELRHEDAKDGFMDFLDFINKKMDCDGDCENCDHNDED